MLDVLIPVRNELASGGDGLCERLGQRAADAATATIPMKAIKGRASFLGDRSIGHEPGCAVVVADDRRRLRRDGGRNVANVGM
jgi:hypothetical protein